MKRTMSLIVAVTLLLNCTYNIKLNDYHEYVRKQPLVINERVGEVIDPNEREKYNLFPGIENFEWAKFYKIEGGGYDIEIKTSRATFIAVNRDTNAVRILGDYIARYDEIKESIQEFDKKWKIAGRDDLGQPITQYEINSVKQLNSTRLWGGTAALLGSMGLLLMGGVASWAREFSGGSGGNYTQFYYATGIIIFGVIAAVLEGHRQDKISAMNAIMEARKPYKVK